MHRVVVVVLAFALGSTACGEDDVGTVPTWFDEARELAAEVDPADAEMRIDPGRPCALVDQLVVDERALEPYGSGVARYEDVGERYQCAWSGGEELAANVRLEVIAIERQPDFTEFASRVTGRDGNEVVTTTAGVVQVATSELDDGGDRTVTRAVLVEPEQRGGVQLVVEVLDPDLAPAWSAQDVADLLATLLA